MTRKTQENQGNEQYFTANPSSEDKRHTITVPICNADYTVEVSHGVFSAGKLDTGTHVLLRYAPDPPQSGNLLDIGCGWGPISMGLATLSPNAQVWGIDVNERAIDLTNNNARRNGLHNVHAVLADNIDPSLTFSCIWSNPPIRIGKEALHEILLTWLPRLEAHGTAYLVVQKHLGSDSLMQWLAQALPEHTGTSWEINKFAQSKGYRIIEVMRQ